MSSTNSGPGAALIQRVRLYERLLDDAYGEQKALTRGWYDGTLLWAHPGYLRPLHGAPVRGSRLQAVRFEAPTIGGPLRAFLQGLPVMPLTMLRTGQAVVLKATWNDTEAQKLAQAMDLPCVPHTRLQVEDDQLLWLDGASGAQRVHQVLRTAGDDQLDPLELGGDPGTGVPGLTHVLRMGQVQVLNFPGAGWLESPWVEAQLPGLCEAVLGEPAQPGPGLTGQAVVQRTTDGNFTVQHLS